MCLDLASWNLEEKPSLCRIRAQTCWLKTQVTYRYILKVIAGELLTGYIEGRKKVHNLGQRPTRSVKVQSETFELGWHML